MPVRLSEIFVSIQGEGQFTGTRTVFVRTTGCNLRCVYCDTPDTSWSPRGTAWTIDQILAEVARHDCEHVVLTGGEPFLPPDIVPLSQALHDAGHVITIETAGTVDRPVIADLMSISPKLSNSRPSRDDRWFSRHVQAQHQVNVIQRLMTDYDYQMKFVIDTPDDLREVDEYLTAIPTIDPQRVWLMPQGVSKAALAERQLWLEPAANERGYRYCPRLHIEMFGHQRGT